MSKVLTMVVGPQFIVCAEGARQGEEIYVADCFWRRREGDLGKDLVSFFTRYSLQDKEISFWLRDCGEKDICLSLTELGKGEVHSFLTWSAEDLFGELSEPYSFDYRLCPAQTFCTLGDVEEGELPLTNTTAQGQVLWVMAEPKQQMQVYWRVFFRERVYLRYKGVCGNGQRCLFYGEGPLFMVEERTEALRFSLWHKGFCLTRFDGEFSPQGMNRGLQLLQEKLATFGLYSWLGVALSGAILQTKATYREVVELWGLAPRRTVIYSEFVQAGLEAEPAMPFVPEWQEAVGALWLRG